MQLRAALHKHSNKSAGSYQSRAEDLGRLHTQLFPSNTDPRFQLGMTGEAVNAFLLKGPIHWEKKYM